ncbi:putative NAD(P)-binding protein [Seiridium unicorne]|uniref:NAD(P)-binding protein n=1 Tax=Seiridium unicorne TaxID=138068 RepID=A0ABR2UKH3_9PEZI
MLSCAHNKFNPETDIPSLTGKTVMVTGGNNGLGLQSVLHFARAGAKVYMCSRSTTKANAVISSINSTNPSADIHVLELELGSLESVKTAAQAFLSANDRLDILMLNAGIMAVPEGIIKDGYEIQFGTNHLGHAALAKCLLPLMVQTAAQPGSDGPWGRYGHSKLANIYFVKELAKHYPQILSVAVHPGGVKGTGLGDTVRATSQSWLTQVALAITKKLMMSVEEGVRGQLWASVADRTEVGAGKVYYPVGKEHKGRELVNDERQVDALWDWTEIALSESEL